MVVVVVVLSLLLVGCWLFLVACCPLLVACCSLLVMHVAPAKWSCNPHTHFGVHAKSLTDQKLLE